uniref:Uncharacterized protein n=1 Tax=Meloidogyne enterolobii TaxID=390850 RepID=A0A6V7XWP5_MELEN|nr:unnamed protein product [Meloidogyne enterolobii]
MQKLRDHLNELIFGHLIDTLKIRENEVEEIRTQVQDGQGQHEYDGQGQHVGKGQKKNKKKKQNKRRN